jgi:carboxymethylenebutenolidase
VAAPTAQRPASPIPDVDAQTVRVPSGTETIEAYVARPKTSEKRAAVLIVHDDMGLTDPVRSVVRLFAQAGFVALTPNLLFRSTTSGAPRRASGEGGEGFGRRTPVMGLPLNQTIDDVKAGLAFLQQDAGVDTAKISAVGMGWGGYRVWKLAEQTPTLYRAVVFYGTTPTDDQVAKLAVPVLAHYAQYDFLLTASALRTQKQLGKRFTYHIYPADRGFLGGSSGSAIDITALAGEQDLFAITSPTRAPTPASSGAPAAGSVAAARLSLERTFAFLRN